MPLKPFKTASYGLATILSCSLMLSCQDRIGPNGPSETPSPQPSTSAPEAGETLARSLNFGFPLTFSTEKMERSISPKQDFPRYAGGAWTAKAELTANTPRVSSFDTLSKIIGQQVATLIADTQRSGTSAPAHSPAQLVGDFFASGVNTERLKQLGSSALKPELDKIAATSLEELPALLAHLDMLHNDPVMLGIGVNSDTQDRSRYSLYLGDGKLPLTREYYQKPEYQKVRDAYRLLITDYFKMVGSSPEQAEQAAEAVMTIEARVSERKLTALEETDPNKKYVRMSFAEAQALTPNLNLEAHVKAAGLPTGGSVIVVDPGAVRERNALIKEMPLKDTLSYLQWELIRRNSTYLSPDFYARALTFNQAITGGPAQPIPAQALLVEEQIKTLLGHPVSQLYVNQYFPQSSKQAVENIIQKVKAEFRSRLTQNTWLSASTRDYALTKLDRMQIAVGYPERWIDYGTVDIKADDYLGNVFRINSYNFQRSVNNFNQPVMVDQFAVAGATLPISNNAAYQPSSNKFEIPAAFLQPPFYNPNADVVVNYCAIGAVVGHEMTHGFDSRGRQYDAQGIIRNWWTEADAQHFTTETQKLVKQASAFEYLPGQYLNGELEVTENLADVGGMTLAYNALLKHLAEHPEDNRTIDGLTPQQRCFSTWAQLWVEKARPDFLRQDVLTNVHPPGSYRVMSPSQHVPGFYEAFGIKAGDPMWMAEQDRVQIW